jgi:hypothetical protein
MNIIAQLGMAFGPAWASGLNLYAMVATLGLLGRFGGMKLPGDLEVLTNKWVIGAAIALYCVEFVADKIPIFDSVWDVVHTFLRVPAGAIVAAAALGDFNRPVQIIAFLAGGGLALSSHGAKAATRAALNLSPEPFSNIIASIIEDVLAILTTALAFVLPVLILTLVIAAFALTIWLLPKIIRLAGRTFSVARRAFAGNASVAR